MEVPRKKGVTTVVATRVDRAGRVVIPLELRRALRLEEGGEVELTLSSDGISISRVATDPTVTVEDGIPVVSLGGSLISNETVLDLIDQDRGVR